VVCVRDEGLPSTLHAEVDGHGPRLVLVHGFTQNRNCWGAVATDLALDHEVLRVDAPGHGKSCEVRAGLSEGARLIAVRGGGATYIGYSMGARFVLHAALANPSVVHGLVLVGGTGGIDEPEARAERRRADAALAHRLEHDGLEAFLDSWLAQPLFAGLSDAAQFREERGENTVDGLADSLRQAGTGSQEPLWPRLSTIDMPVLVIAGEDDEKFSAEAERLMSCIGPNATMALIPDAGHAAHLEQPEAFLATLRQWLADHAL
jgi:2-succinyl-6-hydroxy-2,4-cyclohexadiene-1-carboxylate synthase